MLDTQRKASLGLAIAYLLLMGWSEGWRSALMLVFPLLIPLAMIWYAENIGEYLGWAGRTQIDQATHPALVRWLGWAFLILPGIALVAGCGAF